MKYLPGGTQSPHQCGTTPTALPTAKRPTTTAGAPQSHAPFKSDSPTGTPTIAKLVENAIKPSCVKADLFVSRRHVSVPVRGLVWLHDRLSAAIVADRDVVVPGDRIFKTSSSSDSAALVSAATSGLDDVRAAAFVGGGEIKGRGRYALAEVPETPFEQG